VKGTTALHTITQLDASRYADSVDGLGEVLADAVDGGASLGFCAPFEPGAAAAWWRAQQPAVNEGTLLVWSAEADGRIVGAVGLIRETKANGKHRAEVVKLVVHRAVRGRGLGRALLSAAEGGAAAAGATLLLLDTETGSAAERLYVSAGWSRFGVVPGYAASPAGRYEDSSFFYKHL